MKGTYLGAFQEVVLLVVLVLESEAYGVRIQEEISKRMGRNINRGHFIPHLPYCLTRVFCTLKWGEQPPGGVEGASVLPSIRIWT